jgi:ATP-dependent Lon protease
MPEMTTAKKHKMNLRNKKNDELTKKKVESSSSSDNDDDDSTWVEDEEECDEEDNASLIKTKDYRAMLATMFPSKYMTEKVKNTPENQTLAGDAKKAADKIKQIKQIKQNKKCDKNCDKQCDKLTKPLKKNKKNVEESEDIEDTETHSEDEDEDDENDSTDEFIRDVMKGRGNKFNIIFTMGGKNYDEDDEDDDEDYEDEEEDEEETEDDEEEEDESDEEDDDETSTSSDKKEHTLKQLKTDDEITLKLKEFTSQLKTMGTKDNKLINNIIKSTKQIEKEHKKERERENLKKKTKNIKKFKSLLSSKNSMNDISFFTEKLSYDEQCKILKEMEAVHQYTRIEKPYRLTLLESNIPPQFKACAMKKLNQLRYMEPGSGEYYKIKNWVDTFMEIPFGIRRDLPLTLSDGIDKCHEFIDNAKQQLDNAVYGLNDAKLQIMQMVGQWIANPDAMGTAIAIQGPMGTGKTTLVKDGISTILNREFAFIALGGATDSSFLEGHSYTYEGSTWGKIVDILIKCKTMNPVIYFDELDKVSDTPKGEEIIGILTHLIDTSQNTKFHDKYFSEIDFDLSKCLFIFSYNDETKVNPILRDRMYCIHTSGYNKEEKTTIACDYLLPKIQEQVNFEKDQIIIPNETIQYIIDEYTNAESGVRNLKRCIEIIHTKLNLYRLMKPGTNLFEKEMSMEIQFPLQVTKDIVCKLIKKTEKDNKAPYGMYT